MVSHAALIARGWGIAAVCGVGDLVFEPQASIGGVELREGDCLTVDGGNGAVYLGDWAEAGGEEPAELKTLKRWAMELGIEPGSERTADAPGDEGRGIDAFAVMRALALLGLAADARLAVVACDLERSSALRGGCAATRSCWPIGARTAARQPEGRGWLQAQLDAERGRTDQVEADRLYGAFAAARRDFQAYRHGLAGPLRRWPRRHQRSQRRYLRHHDPRKHWAPSIRETAPLIDEIVALDAAPATYRLRFARAAAAIATGDGIDDRQPVQGQLSHHLVRTA